MVNTKARYKYKGYYLFSDLSRRVTINLVIIYYRLLLSMIIAMSIALRIYLSLHYLYLCLYISPLIILLPSYLYHILSQGPDFNLEYLRLINKQMLKITVYNKMGSLSKALGVVGQHNLIMVYSRDVN